MESIFRLSTDSCESSIKFTKKLFKGQAAWVSFNILILCFDWHDFISSPSRLSSFAFGAMMITALWSIVFLLETYGELKGEKLRLKHLTEFNDTNMASMERKQYIQAKEHYEQLANLNLRTNNDPGIR